MKEMIKNLCDKLGYTFNQVKLLETALTHRSAKGPSNERLEFLGDSVLNFTIAAALYERKPNATEGELSRLRANLVNGNTLAELAKELDVGQYLRLGSGEMKSGGKRRASILADTMEALIGAIFLDGGILAAQNCIIDWYTTRIKDPEGLQVVKDAKTRLQEYLQAHKLPLPVYRVAAIEGKDHDQTFAVECVVESLTHKTQGHGTSRRRAEQEAAEAFLLILEQKI